MIRIVLADDQPLVRMGFRALLDSEDDLEVVGEAGTGEEAVRVCAREKPDVAILDIRMPDLDGLAATHRIVAEHGDSVRVLILTTFELDEYVFEALRAGASGFLVKHTVPAELIQAVHVIHAGEALLSPSVTRRLIARFAAGPPLGAGAPDPAVARLLTARELQAVELVAEGLSNGEIAERWVVSDATVRTHVSRAMTKLAARDRAQLVVLAYRLGLAAITPE
ncbi:response regulator transcription factor [Tsukamurella sp. 1534]|uniref:response regulator transcription factor n=1 Tax=Tsukamurella sp. 1534 TaxID=1151061 RepID=UPI000592AD87|nr:response regulator transcription factor [Tsukamurella sp. 1534]